jgi:hypothetical protein
MPKWVGSFNKTVSRRALPRSLTHTEAGCARTRTAAADTAFSGAGCSRPMLQKQMLLSYPLMSIAFERKKAMSASEEQANVVRLQSSKLKKTTYLDTREKTMTYIGGSTRSNKLLETLHKEGSLVSPYTEQWFKDVSSKGSWNIEEFHELRKTHGADFIGHILFLYVDHYNVQNKSELSAVYPPLKQLFRSGQHHPDFLILNLPRNEVLALGLGRKNQLFANFIASNGSCVETSDIDQFRCATDFLSFVSLDHAGLVDDLITALEELGMGFERWDSLPLNPGELQELLDSDRESEDFSREEIADLLEEYETADTIVEDSAWTINQFFPNLDVNELNTGDY